MLSDEKNHKTTYVSLYGMEKAREDVERLSDEELRKIWSGFRVIMNFALADLKAGDQTKIGENCSVSAQTC